MICFAISDYSLACFLGYLGGCFQDAEDLVLPHDQILFAIQLDVAARILAKQDAITHLHVQRDHFAVFQTLALAYRHHFALLGLLFGGVGNVQAALHLLFFFHSLDHDPVVQRSNLHVGTSTHNFVGLRIWSRLTAARRFRDNIISTLTPSVTRFSCKLLKIVSNILLDGGGLSAVTEPRGASC